MIGKYHRMTRGSGRCIKLTANRTGFATATFNRTLPSGGRSRRASVTCQNECKGELPKGVLISDQYAYNDLTVGQSDPTKPSYETRNVGLHWVGDIGLECDLDIGAGGGEFALDIVEGGVHFICTIDTATGVAKLSTKTETDSVVQFVDADLNVVAEPTGKTSIGPGSHRLLLVNADDQLHLWVDGALIEFDAATYLRSDIPHALFLRNGSGRCGAVGNCQQGSVFDGRPFEGRSRPLLHLSDQGLQHCQRVWLGRQRKTGDLLVVAIA